MKIKFLEGLKQIHCFNQVMTDLNINGNILGTRNDGGTTNEIKLTMRADGTINKDLLPDHFQVFRTIQSTIFTSNKRRDLGRAQLNMDMMNLCMIHGLVFS